MIHFKNYETLELIKSYNKNINLWLLEDNNGNDFEGLTIKVKEEFKNILKRAFNNEIAPFYKNDVQGVQKIIEYDYDSVNNQYYIIYENTQETFAPVENYNKENLLSFVKTLNALKNSNRYGFYISPETFLVGDNKNTLIKYVGLFEIFKVYNLLNEDYLSPEVLSNKLPRLQDDIYALGKLYQSYLSLNTDISKFLSEKKEDRFRKYADIIKVVKTFQEDESEQIARDTIQIIAKEQESFKPILDEMNQECYWLLDPEKSNKGDFTGEFATNNYAGRYFVDHSNYLFVMPYQQNNGSIIKIKTKGERANFHFSELSSSFNILDYFEEKFDEKNVLAELHTQHHNALKKWKVLPKNEKKFIEEQAFKSKYSKRELTKSNNQNIRFVLNDESIDWQFIKKLKNENVILSINDDEIGKIQTYDSKESTLIVKDALIEIDEIPEKGEIIQDVSQETSQYTKQEKACEQFKARDILNPEIASILATPEQMPVSNRVVLDYESFIEKVKSPYLKNDESQRDAVLEAINKKPVYLIQGPPGTGKTTVIVEIIEQLVQQNTNVKILITSQSNLAVDNVLEKLVSKDILFMRLVSDLAVENDNVSPEIADHLFNTKLQQWINNTQNNSNQYVNSNFGDKSKNKVLIDFYAAYNRLDHTKREKQFLNTFLNDLRFRPRYIKNLFENVKSKKDIDAIFSNELGEQYLELIKIQKDWFSFISNATTIEGKKKKSMLNNGSTEIDLHTAFCKTINVFGATCIHIASSKYSDIDFKFDYVIMDESSKASPAETLVPVTMAKNLILIGDHKQLPPVVTREEAIKDKIKKELDDNGLDFNKEFGVSLFETLINAFQNTDRLKSYTKMLDIQYRMPRQLGYLISKHFYSDNPESVLKNPDVRLDTLKNYDVDKFHQLNLMVPNVTILDSFTKAMVKVPSSILFISTSNKQNPQDNGNPTNRNNACNVTTIQNVLKTLNKQYQANLEQENPFTIGVIAGYRGQVMLLKEKINTKAYSNFYNKPNSLIEINTVDKFQGAERDIIIYDIVKSSRGKDTIGFLDDYRRINVAFSRAKRLLIIVGDSEFILKRAKLHPKSDFKEFKLKDIVQELSQQNLVFNTLKEAIND